MAKNKYVTKGYSTYTDIPARQGGYDSGPNNRVNWYVVKTTIIEGIRTPTGTNFGGSSSKTELMKEFAPALSMLIEPEYAPKEHHEGYEPNYELGYENSSPPRYHGQDDPVEDFFHKVQIEANRPTEIGNFSSPDRSRPSNLNSYRPSGPNKYQSSSPNKYRSSSPNKHRPSSPNKNHPLSPNSSWPSSPNKYRSLSPNNYQPSSVNKNQPSNPSSGGARHVRIGNFSSPNNSWQSAGPPVTRHPLTTPTNDINEALSLFPKSGNYSPNSSPKIRGGGGKYDSSTHVQIIEPERQYTRSAFGNATTEPHYNNPKSEYIIDSKDAMKKYGGTFVP